MWLFYCHPRFANAMRERGRLEKFLNSAVGSKQVDVGGNAKPSIKQYY